MDQKEVFRESGSQYQFSGPPQDVSQCGSQFLFQGQFPDRKE
jgi:hypothetical protein